MPQFDTRPFIPQTNQAIINAIRRTASSDYRSRIPLATQANITETIRNIVDVQANRNEFISALVNRIGLVIARQQNWTNPLGKYKRGILQFGETIEEVQTGLLKAHTYSASREYLEQDIFGVETPDVQTTFHKRNRQNFYKVTVNESELRRAFLEEGGLSSFVASIMSAPATSDQWDEYLLTVRMFREFYDNDGFFKVRIPDVSGLESDTPDAQAALRAIRTMTDTLPFISTNYNAAHMPVAAERDELELIVTPEFNAAMDVNALAAAFNIEHVRIAERQTVVRQEDMNIPGAQAILTTRDFFVIADTYYDTTSMPNPAGRTQNYFLHHDQVLSVSRFVPAILFTSSEDTTPIVISDPELATISGLTVTDRQGDTVTTIPRGDFYEVSAQFTTEPTGQEAPVILTMTGAKSSYTTLSQDGRLFVGVDETATALVIIATDPDGNPTFSETFNLSGDVARLWPDPGIVDTLVPTVTAVTPTGAKAGDTITITGTEFDDVTAVTVGGTAVTSFDIEDSGELTAVMPTGSAGSAPLIVTNNVGPSAAFAYTRAA